MLTETRHRQTACALPGDEALSHFEVAARFSEVLGREIRCPNSSVLHIIRHRRRQGYP